MKRPIWKLTTRANSVMKKEENNGFPLRDFISIEIDNRLRIRIKRGNFQNKIIEKGRSRLGNLMKKKLLKSFNKTDIDKTNINDAKPTHNLKLTEFNLPALERIDKSVIDISSLLNKTCNMESPTTPLKGMLIPLNRPKLPMKTYFDSDQKFRKTRRLKNNSLISRYKSGFENQIDASGPTYSLESNSVLNGISMCIHSKNMRSTKKLNLKNRRDECSFKRKTTCAPKYEFQVKVKPRNIKYLLSTRNRATIGESFKF